MNAPVQRLTDLVHRPHQVAGVPGREASAGAIAGSGIPGRGRAFLVGFLLFVSASAAVAAEVTFDIQPRRLNLGETAQATLVFHGIRGLGGIELPPIEGLSITAPAVIQQTINGVHSVRMDYRIFPQRAGTFAIGPYSLDMQGQEVQIPEIQLEVRATSADATSRELLFARLRLPESPPFVHQVFEIELQLYALPTVELARDVNLAGGFPETGLVLGGFEELQVIREEVDGVFYNLRRFRARARAVSPGQYALQPTLRVHVVDRHQPARRRDPFFSGFFDDPFARPATTPVEATAPPQTLTVRAIPEEGRPDDFTGAVGRFEFNVDVRPRELRVGEPLTVSLRLQGVGNIAAARPPAYLETEEFRAFEARLVGDAPEPAAERGAKTFQQVLFPRTADIEYLPALRFSYFDPDAGRYESITAGPFPLTVHPTENGGVATVLQIPGMSGSRALVLGRDIVYQKAAPARWRAGPPSPWAARLAVAAHAAAPVVLAGLYLATRRRRRLASDIALARRQKAPRIARANLRQAEKALHENAGAAAVFAPLAAAASDYFGHRLNLPPGAVDAGRVLDWLRQADATPDELNQWREFFALSDQVRFASALTLAEADLSAWVAAVASLLRKAERIKR